MSKQELKDLIDRSGAEEVGGLLLARAQARAYVAQAYSAALVPISVVVSILAACGMLSVVAISDREDTNRKEALSALNNATIGLIGFLGGGGAAVSGMVMAGGRDRKPDPPTDPSEDPTGPLEPPPTQEPPLPPAPAEPSTVPEEPEDPLPDPADQPPQQLGFRASPVVGGPTDWSIVPPVEPHSAKGSLALMRSQTLNAKLANR